MTKPETEWVIVPKKATREMLAKGWELLPASWQNTRVDYVHFVFEAMLAAAPPAPVPDAVREQHPISAEWWRSGIVAPKTPREWRELCSRMVSEIDRLYRPAIANDKKDDALNAINTIRNSIVGTQTVNWSEHIYPLVAALEDAGYEGMEYPEAREHFGSLIERTNAAEARATTAEKALGTARGALVKIEKWFGEFPPTGKYWDEERTEPTSYAAEYGSNGERDFMRAIAREALAALPSPPITKIKGEG